MAGHGAKKKRREEHGEHPDERWLVTYADLMTLLVALFMVLFSISSVNKSKFESLQQSLQDAFSGRILPGGQSIKQSGGSDNIKTPSVSAPQSSLQPYVGGKPQEATKTGATAKDKAGAAKAVAAAAAKEQSQFAKLKARLDRAAAKQGLASQVHTTITKDGLLIRLVTDGLLFDSGSAVVRPQSGPLLGSVAQLLATEPDHSLFVQGNTDDVPVHSAQFIDNLALSGARAEAIYRVFAADGITAARMTAAGKGDTAPLASNATAAGRSLNRRVEILVPRTVSTDTSASTAVAKATSPSIRPNLTPTR